MVSRTRALSKLLNTDNKIAETSFSQDIVLGPEQYATPDDLPFVGNSVGDQAFVASNNRLYIWSGSGWYSVALINTNPSFDSGGLPLEQYLLNSDNPSALITLLATDPEGVPITYSATTDSGSDFVTILQGSGDSSNIFTVNLKSLDSIVSSGYDSSFEAVFDITFKASDGINLASALSEFTITFVTRIENSRYTTLLMKAVNTNTNSTFTDASTNSHTITANGDVYAGTFSPCAPGGYSYYFDGTDDYISFPYDANLVLNTSFTIEFWTYMLSGDGGGYNIVSFYQMGEHNFRIDGASDGTSLNLLINQTDTVLNVTSGIDLLNDWHHIAYSYDGTTIKLFVDGVLKGSATRTVNQTQTGGNMAIGINTASVGTVYDYKGYISDLRHVRGTAVYTSAFTPPTERLTAITNTELLTCHLPYIVDGSSNEHTITLNGNTSTQPFSPFDYVKYDPEVHGGSAYFDGNGDYLATSLNNNFVSKSYTIEGWYYPTINLTGSHSLFNVGVGTSSTDRITVGISSGTMFHQHEVSNSNTKTVISGGMDGYDLAPDQWHHIEMVFDWGGAYDASSTGYIFMNGILQESYRLSGHVSSSIVELSRSNIAGANRYFPGYISNFRVLQGVALHTSNFTPPTEPLTAIPNTSLLLNFTNAGIIDNTGKNNLKTVGNVQVDTTVKKYGTGSIKFDGSGDYLVSPDSDFYHIGASDFTLEGWIYKEDKGTWSSLIGQRDASTAEWRVILDINNLSTYTPGNFRLDWGSDILVWSSANIPNDAWTHFALVRSGTTGTLYINGTSVGTNTLNNISNYSAPLRIGTNDGTGEYYQGYIEDLRITKGLARYTENFTPPTRELLG